MMQCLLPSLEESIALLRALALAPSRRGLGFLLGREEGCGVAHLRAKRGTRTENYHDLGVSGFAYSEVAVVGRGN